MLFSYFGIPSASQQRVLVFGVLGAIGLRAILIFIGAALIAVAMLASLWIAPRPKRAS